MELICLAQVSLGATFLAQEVERLAPQFLMKVRLEGIRVVVFVSQTCWAEGCLGVPRGRGRQQKSRPFRRPRTPPTRPSRPRGQLWQPSQQRAHHQRHLLRRQLQPP